jgi:hypothetical protein
MPQYFFDQGVKNIAPSALGPRKWFVCVHFDDMTGLGGSSSCPKGATPFASLIVHSFVDP